MATVTDASFVPIGHDQITASFFSNGLTPSATPIGAPKGRNHSFRICFYPLPQRNILLPLAWWWRDKQITPHHYLKETSPACALWDQTCSCSLSSALSNPIWGYSVTMVATVRTHRRYLNRVGWCLSDNLQQQMSVYLWRQMPCSKNMKVYLIRHILLSVSRLIGT